MDGIAERFSPSRWPPLLAKTCGKPQQKEIHHMKLRGKLARAVKLIDRRLHENPAANLVVLVDEAAVGFDLLAPDSDFLLRFLKNRAREEKRSSRATGGE